MLGGGGAFSPTTGTDTKVQVEVFGGVVTRGRSTGCRKGSWESSAQGRDHIMAGIADGDPRRRFPESLSSPFTVSLGLLCPCWELPAPGFLAKYLPLAYGQCQAFGGFLHPVPRPGVRGALV